MQTGICKKQQNYRDRDWIYIYCRLFGMGWDVEMGTHIQTGTDKLNNNVQIQTHVRL